MSNSHEKKTFIGGTGNFTYDYIRHDLPGGQEALRMLIDAVCQLKVALLLDAVPQSRLVSGRYLKDSRSRIAYFDTPLRLSLYGILARTK